MTPPSRPESTVPTAPRPLRLVVMGTGPFAVPLFHRLLATEHAVVAVVTRPDRTAAGRRPPPNPMREAATAAGIPVIAPDSINSPDAIAALTALAPDLLVVCDYGQILSREALAVAPLGGINLHGSLLPRHRGAAPVQWAILAGDATTGASVIHMTPALDAGNVLAAIETPIGEAETAAELEPRLAELGAGIVPAAIAAVAAAGPGAAVGVPQDKSLVTPAPRLKKADGVVDWSQPAERIERQRRALEPWPRATTFLHSGPAEAAGVTARPPLRIVLEDVAVAAGPAAAPAEPGRIVAADDSGIVVACGGPSRLLVRRLVPEGRRSMSAAEFLRGHALFAAARFGHPAAGA
jgi:methionyl-tRNA formyltransferase